MHGSTGAGLVRAAEAGGGSLPVCLTVTLLDGLVLARSQFEHSELPQRGGTGRAELVTDPAERDAALRAIVEHVAAGRSEQSRAGQPPGAGGDGRAALPLAEVSLKERSGRPEDDPQDVPGPFWAGVLDLRTVPGTVRRPPTCRRESGPRARGRVPQAGWSPSPRGGTSPSS